MSMILILENVSTTAAVETNEPATIPLNPSADWGAGMLIGAREGDENSISLEKAWHGLHFLLTGDPWGGAGYRAFLLCGGREQGEDMGYGPARLFDADEVGEIANTLGGISAEELWSRFDAERMEEAEVYPGIWDEPEEDLREEYVEYFEMLKDFVLQTAKDGNSLRISMM
jgi:hypothetical protein